MMNDIFNPFTLKGKTILITGASSGIGRETAVSCSKMGATVIVTGRDKKRLQETFDNLVGEKNIQILADLTTEEGLSSLISMISHLDGVVLCAGKGLTLPLQFATREKFNETYSPELDFIFP